MQNMFNILFAQYEEDTQGKKKHFVNANEIEVVVGCETIYNCVSKTIDNF